MKNVIVTVGLLIVMSLTLSAYYDIARLSIDKLEEKESVDNMAHTLAMAIEIDDGEVHLNMNKLLENIEKPVSYESIHIEIDLGETKYVMDENLEPKVAKGEGKITATVEVKFKEKVYAFHKVKNVAKSTYAYSDGKLHALP